MLPITTTRIYKMVRVIIDFFSFFYFPFFFFPFFFPFFFKHQVLKLPNEFLLGTE